MKAKDANDLKVNKIVKQIQKEYSQAYDNQRSKISLHKKRLKLYNNQKRKKDAVGDTTLFSVFQTLLASLYADSLDVVFKAGTVGAEDAADNLTAMAKYDYRLMEKDEIDYDWDWDTLFFGRSMVMFDEFKRDPEANIYVPVPEVVDPLTLLRDPYALSLNGNVKGKGAARFWGRELYMTKREMMEHPVIKLGADEEISRMAGKDSLLEEAVDARHDAQGRQTQRLTEAMGMDLGVNTIYNITEWFTWIEHEGKPVMIRAWLANEREKLLGFKILDFKFWNAVDRVLYPTSHDWDGTSLPDLLEDKQRARAVAQNLGLRAMKADVYPMYIYDSKKIKNRNDLNFGFNKFIPVDAQGENVAGAITPLIKSRPNLQLLSFIYETLDLSAQKATASNEIQQGILTSKDKTLGELNLVTSKSENRFSLAAKIFGWSEKRFWRQWYWMYKKYFKDGIDEKMIDVVSPFGGKWKPLKKKDIVHKVDPRIQIEPRSLSRAKQIEERVLMQAFVSMASTYPDFNLRWALKKLARVSGYTSEEVNILFPKTVDERRAEEENELLNQNKLVEIRREDDHNVHLEVHAKAKETDAWYAHVKAHEEALRLKKERPELFADIAQQADSIKQEQGSVQSQSQNDIIKALTPSQTSNQPQ